MDATTWALIGFGVASLVTASSGAVFKPGPWYDALRRPSWTPPNWAFPVVWTLLFCLIAYSAWLVWCEVGWGLALTVYAAQLVLNAVWSALFFGMRRMGLALIDLALLWLSILAMIILYYPASPLAALLTLPYLAWVTTAGFLNHAFWRLNPDQPADRSSQAARA